MTEEPVDPVRDLREVERRLAETNALLAEWTACSAERRPSLIERLEQMGYDVRGKSREAIAEVLKHPPTQAARTI